MTPTTLAALLAHAAAAAAEGPLLWPLPQSYTHGTGSASLPATPSGFFGAPATPLLGRAFARYSEIIFDGCGTANAANAAASSSSSGAAITSGFDLAVDVPDATGPEEHMDEWYELDVPASGPARARARTQCEKLPKKRGSPPF